tara:strand:- start:2947 stop:4374 length:1428 start_codon:yes stop_codon:yes gene_type:complete
MDKKLITYKESLKLNKDQVTDLYRKYINSAQVDLISSFGFGNELIDRAKGCYLYTKNGKKILDATGGIGVLNHGHNHDRILKVRRDFSDNNYMEVHKNYFSPYLAALSHNIAALLPEDLNISYFPNSGAEAVEGAVKMAYKFHQGDRQHILHSDISFHGKLLGAASLTGSPELSFDFPKIPNVDKFIYNDIKSVKDKIDQLIKSNGESNIYAIIIEPINASSMRSCSEHFLKELRNICTINKIVLIYDEVYTGWAKTGNLFSFMKYSDTCPDIVTYAKSFGGGKSSISGYTTRDYIFRKAYDNSTDATLHSTTYNGFGEETVTALEAVNIIIEDNYVGKAKEIGLLLEESLTKLKNKYPKIIKEVRGEGALWGIIIDPGLLGKAFEGVSKLLPIGLLGDNRLARKVFTGSVISYLYDECEILTFFGSNGEIPLIISLPLIATKEEIDNLHSGLDKTFSYGLINLTTRFIKNKLSG